MGIGTKEGRILNRECYHCGNKLPDDRKAQACAKCQKISEDKRAERTAKRKESGLCQCGQPPVLGRISCEKCIKIGKNLAIKRREKFRGSGLCIECGGINDRSALSCKICTDKRVKKNKNRVKNNREMGLCRCGGRPVEGAKTCISCRESANKDNKIRRDAFISKGLCSRCGKTPYLATLSNGCDSNKLCDVCYLKDIARRHTSDQSKWIELKEKLLNQNYRCTQSGKILELGGNASVDHIKPKSQFPELAKDVNNLEWIDYDVNMMKDGRTPEQFLSIINKIIEHLG